MTIKHFQRIKFTFTAKKHYNLLKYATNQKKKNVEKVNNINNKKKKRRNYFPVLSSE